MTTSERFTAPSTAKAIEPSEPVTITLNGEPIVVQKGQLLIEAAEQAGTYIPRFCYHSRMSSVGMCRMCLVEVDTGRGPALQPSCMLECGDGMVVQTESPGVVAAQDGVVEFLLANHPLDCPVCDKGGECPLQDQTVGFGPGESRWVEEKRHYEKPIPISSIVQLDRERCILCDRCTRFASEVAGDPLIHFIGRGANTRVGTFPDHPFASYFSGNTVQICPVGALTATPYRFAARPWDLDEVESTCTTCALGCRVAVQSSRNQIVRVQGVDSDAVNWSWLCDKGRFAFQAINSPARLTAPLQRRGAELYECDWSTAFDAASSALRVDPSRIGVIGGARLTNEAAIAWSTLLKGFVGTDNVDCQLGDGLDGTVVVALPRATIDDVCNAPVVLYLGPDPREELGVLHLRLRDAALRRGTTLVEVTPAGSGLSTYASHTVHYSLGEAAATVRSLLTATGEDDLADAGAALGDGPLVVVVGRPTVAESANSIHAAIAAILDARPGSTFLPVLTRGNIMGALDAGLSPGLLPGRRELGSVPATWLTAPSTRGLDTAGILRTAADGGIDTLLLLGADPLEDYVDRELAERAFSSVRNIIAIDTLPNESVGRAHLILPAAGYGETEGTTTNIEGRVSVLRQKVTPVGSAQPDWVIASQIGQRLGAHHLGPSPAATWAEHVATSSAHAGLSDDELSSSTDGLVAVGSAVPLDASRWATDTDLPPADAYGVRLVLTTTMYDGSTQTQASPALAPLATGLTARLAPYEADKLGIGNGDRITVSRAGRSITAPVRVDHNMPRGAVALNIVHGPDDPRRLLDHDRSVTDVRLEVAR